jgi:hypothetical protein
MGDGQTHIIVTLDTKEPIEIGDFATAFTSVASQYNKFMTDNHPEMGGDARVYVKEVRSGSIIADLIPVLTAFGVAGSTLVAIQQADAIVDFANIKRPAMEKRTGERVIIEEMAKADRPLIYASELAKRQIKHEMIEADENVYKKGFVVDVYIETKNDRPVAYKVTNLHSETPKVFPKSGPTLCADRP